MRLNIQLKPLLVHTARETADVKPTSTDTYIDVLSTFIPVETRQSAIDKMVEINLQMHDFIAKLTLMGPSKIMRWNYAVNVDGVFYIDAELPRQLTEQEYYLAGQMLEHIANTITKGPISKKSGDKNILLSLKTEISVLSENATD